MVTKTKAPSPDYVIKELHPFCIPLDTLNLDPENSRHHDRRNLDVIKRSLVEFKQYLPIIIQKEGMIVRVGNGRVMSARELGWEFIAGLIVDEDNVEAVKRSLLDNRSAELGVWDTENLIANIELLSDQVNLEDYGWSDDELAEFRMDITPPTIPPGSVPVGIAQSDSGKSGLVLSDAQLPSPMKMVQLFYNTNDHDEFVKICEQLKTTYESETYSDTVLRALRRITNDIGHNNDG